MKRSRICPAPAKVLGPDRKRCIPTKISHTTRCSFCWTYWYAFSWMAARHASALARRPASVVNISSRLRRVRSALLRWRRWSASGRASISASVKTGKAIAPKSQSRKPPSGGRSRGSAPIADTATWASSIRGAAVTATPTSTKKAVTPRSALIHAWLPRKLISVNLRINNFRNCFFHFLSIYIMSNNY